MVIYACTTVIVVIIFVDFNLKNVLIHFLNYANLFHFFNKNHYDPKSPTKTTVHV